MPIGPLNFPNYFNNTLDGPKVENYLQCRARVALLVRKGEICVNGKYNGNPTSACQGDSGGPLVCGTDGDYTLYGATSRGKKCDGVSIYSGVADAMPWMRMYIKGL